MSVLQLQLNSFSIEIVKFKINLKRGVINYLLLSFVNDNFQIPHFNHKLKCLLLILQI